MGFTECGEIEKLRLPLNDEGNPKGFCFIQYKDRKGVEAALKFDGEQYSGRRLSVRMAGDKAEGKGKGKDGGKADRDPELTVFVRGLPFATDEATLRKDFTECGEIKS